MSNGQRVFIGCFPFRKAAGCIKPCPTLNPWYDPHLVCDLTVPLEIWIHANTRLRQIQTYFPKLDLTPYPNAS